MIAKNWKEILVFTVSLIISLMTLVNGEKFLGKDYSSIVFSIFLTVTIIFGVWILINISVDKDLEKIIETKRELTEEEIEEREKWAGKLEIINNEIVFNYNQKQLVNIKISDLKVIGEFTTNTDPIATDWYLIIVKKNNEVIYIPTYAVGLEDTLKQLSKTLHHEIVPKLFSSINFDSNVIYPKSITGEKLFQLSSLNPNGFWKKIKVNMGFSPITPILRNEITELKE